MGGKMANNLSKSDLYRIYTENIHYANHQLEVIKRQARQLAGEYYWYDSNNKKSQIRKELIIELKAMTNLYAYILGSKFELQLMKILHDSSSAAFSKSEFKQIMNEKTIYDMWTKCLDISFSKSSYIDWTDVGGLDLKALFKDKNSFLDEFQEIITMRNRLAHGQWSVQLNSNRTQKNTPTALNKYNDISKLVLLSNKLDIMVKIVETIVVYKDKDTVKFREKINKLVEENRINDARIKNISLETYVEGAVKKFNKKKINKKKATRRKAIRSVNRK